METIKLCLYFSFFCLYLQGCIGVAYNKKLNGPYYLTAMDAKEDMEIQYVDKEDYAFSIIRATVFAVGGNKDFIIAKQHPRDTSGNIDKKIVNYFIIPVKRRISTSMEKNIFGPLTLEEFNQKKRELGLRNMKFKIVFKDLEKYAHSS